MQLTVDVNFVEVEHPREGAAHGGKKPGEFAPKEGGTESNIAQRLASAHKLPEDFSEERADKKFSAPFIKEVLGKGGPDSYAGTFAMVMQSCLRKYTGEWSDAINDHLRHPDNDYGEGVDRLIDGIDAAMKVAPPLKKDVVVWRGMRTTPKNITAIKQALDSETPVSLTNEGYSSTSLLKDASVFFSALKPGPKLVIKCLVPKGTRAVYMEPMTASAGEMELLLNRNSKLRVVSMEKTGKNHYQLTTELESPEPDELKKAA